MALSHEDKKDVSAAFGKKAAGAVSRATHDNSMTGRAARERNMERAAFGRMYREASGGDAKNKALHAKTGMPKEVAHAFKTNPKLESYSRVMHGRWERNNGKITHTPHK